MTTEANADIATIRQRWANLPELLYRERHDDEDARYIIDARLDDEEGTLIQIDEPDADERHILQLAADASRDVPALLAALDAATAELNAGRAYRGHFTAVDFEDQNDEEYMAWEREERRLAALWDAAIAAGSSAHAGTRTGPHVVCLCGSTRFYTAFQEANYRETMAGNIVLTVGFYPHAADRAHGEELGVTPEQKVALDELHKRKIDMCDEVFVLNVGGYIGESTRSEIAYAERVGKPVRYLETNA